MRDLKLHNNRPPARECISQTTGPRWHWINDVVKLLHFKQFSQCHTHRLKLVELYLSWIQRYIWGKLAETSISKPILHYFGVNSISGLTADRCGTEQSWNRPVFDSASLIWSIGHINRRGKNQFIVGFPRRNMNDKGTDHDVRESKVLTVKSRTETHFRKTNISSDLSSRNGPDCSNVICKMLLWSKLIRGTQRPFSGMWSEMPRYASWSALKAI